MTTYTAAYCAACRAYVLVAADGGCEHGHPRASLRGLYAAEVDRRTGRPMPPSLDQRRDMSQAVPPVAPIAEGMQAPVAQPSMAARTAMLTQASATRQVGSLGAVREAFDQLFGPPRGRHSARRWGK